MGEAASPTPRFMRTSLFYGDGKRGSNGDVTFGRYRVRNVNDVGSFEFRIFEHRDYSQGTRTRQRAPRPPPPPSASAPASCATNSARERRRVWGTHRSPAEDLEAPPDSSDAVVTVIRVRGPVCGRPRCAAVADGGALVAPTRAAGHRRKWTRPTTRS